MLYETAPEDFDQRFEIASCFVEHDGEILLLHRHDNKSQGGKWGVVAGKLDEGETIEEAMLREMLEETGIVLATQDLTYFGNRFVRHPEADFVYHMFSAKLPERPEVVIEPHEHRAHAWVSPTDALTLPLIDDMEECIRLFYGSALQSSQ